jgi:hypothetical protein
MTLLTRSPSANAISRTTAGEFLELLPRIERHARLVFRALPLVEREEAVAEAVAAAFVTFRRLRARGLDPAHAFPSLIARYAALHVKDGRQVGSRRSSKDVLSPQAQRKHGFRVEFLPLTTRRPHEDLYGEGRGQRHLDVYEERLHDNHRTPPPEQAAFRVDFPEFLDSLSRRDRRLATYLSLGHSAKAAANRFGLSAGRVTQLRQSWCRDWHVRSGDELPRRLDRHRNTSPEQVDRPAPGMHNVACG